MKKTSWKTTLGGVLGAIGPVIATSSTDKTVQAIGTLITSLGTLLIGLAARDNNVTSEQAGAAPGK